MCTERPNCSIETKALDPEYYNFPDTSKKKASHTSIFLPN
jgi:hypothetical protein